MEPICVKYNCELEAVIMSLQGREKNYQTSTGWKPTGRIKNWNVTTSILFNFLQINWLYCQTINLTDLLRVGSFTQPLTERKLRVLWRIDWCLLIMNLAECRWDILNTDILDLVVIISLADCKMTYYCLTNQTERKYQLQSLIYEENFKRNLWRVPPR